MKSISNQLESMAEDKNIFKKSNLFNCILGLNEIESKVLSYLLKNDKVSTIELTNIINRDRSSLQRALGELLERNVIIRESMSLKDYIALKNLSDDNNKRGYIFVYRSKNLVEIKEMFRNLLDKWYNSMLNFIDKL